MTHIPENVTINVAQTGVHEIRFGEAEKVLVAQKVAVNGNIKAPLEWFKKKYLKIEENNDEACFFGGFYRKVISNDECHVEVDTKAGSVLLVIQEYSEARQEIKGELLPHYAMDIFPINKDTKLTLTDLRSLIQRNAYWFADADKHTKLLTDLQNFKVSLSKDITNTNDNKGNMEMSAKITTLLKDISLDFSLKMPVYVGTDPQTFAVETYIDADGANVTYQLVSPALLKIKEELKDQELKAALGDMEKEFAIIWK